MDHNKGPKPVVETPSATTSQEDATSGSFAYVITGVALACVVALSLLGAGCVSLALNIAADNSSSSRGGSYGNAPIPFDDYDGYDFYDDYDDMGFDEWLRRYEEQMEGGSSVRGTDTAGEASVAEVLDFDIAPYGSTIDTELSANAYAGAPQNVRDYVRAVVTVDKDYATKVATLLNQAARSEEGRADRIREAVAACSEARTAISDVVTPDQADAGVVDLLGSARGSALSRWEHMETELTMLDTQDPVDKSRLWSEDDEVIEATEDAADFLREAMEKAASN